VGSCLHDSKKTSAVGRGVSDVSDDTTQFDSKKVLSCSKLRYSSKLPGLVEYGCRCTCFFNILKIYYFKVLEKN
jgi:hypothetical protein